MRVLATLLALEALTGLALCGPLSQSYASIVAWLVVEHSRVYDVFAPWEREIKLAATEALEWEVADYEATPLTYYDLLYNAILHSNLKKASKYLGVFLCLLLKAKGYTETRGRSLLPVLEGLDWDTIRILDMSPEEVVDYRLLYKPKDSEDFAYTCASVALSLLERLPVNSFIRVLSTPLLREMYLLSFAAVLAA